MPRARFIGTVASGILLLGAALVAQFGGGGQSPRGFLGEPRVTNPPYDGRYMFARVKYTPGPGGYYYRGLPAWAHGYIPDGRRGSNRAENSLVKILNEISYLNGHDSDSVVFAFDDPELFKYPIAYMTEPGFWTLTDREAESLRAYLLKGGFLIVDDFRHDGDPRQGGGWANMEANFRRAIPEGRFARLEVSHPVFDSFFHIDSFNLIPQAYDAIGPPEFWGLFEDNDPSKRLMVVVNYSTDVSDFWEFSATGFRPIEESNEAYKLGVDYIIYGMTH